MAGEENLSGFLFLSKRPRKIIPKIKKTKMWPPFKFYVSEMYPTLSLSIFLKSHNVSAGDKSRDIREAFIRCKLRK